MKVKLTGPIVTALQPDPDPRKRLVVWDMEVPGFGVTVTPYTKRKDGTRGGGVKSYIVQYRPGGRGTPTRRVTIGRHGVEWQPGPAREEAREILRQRRQGIDPFEERRRRRAAEEDAKAAAAQEEEVGRRFEYAAFRAEFIEEYAKAHQPKSWEGTERALKDLGTHLDGKRVDSIKRDEIRDAIKSIHKRSPSAGIAANKALKKLYSWANAEHIFSYHPMLKMAAPSKGTKRKRVLNSTELKVVWDAALQLGYPFGWMYALELVTGLRRENAAGLLRGEFYPAHEKLVIAGARMKREAGDERGDFHLPLNSYGLMLVESAAEHAPVDRHVAELKRPLFTAKGTKPVRGFSLAKKLLDEKIKELAGAPLPHWTGHDLRRTMATVMQLLGVDDRVIALLQDHKIKLPSKADEHYQHAQFQQAKREAVELYGQYLRGAIEGDKRFVDMVHKVDFDRLEVR